MTSFYYRVALALRRLLPVLAPTLLAFSGAGPALGQGPAAAASPARLEIHTVAPTATGTRPALRESPTVLRRALNLGPQDDLRLLRTETDDLGFRHQRYQQYYGGVKVEHGTVSAHGRADQLETWSGTVQRPPAALRTQPTLSEAAALQQALAAVGARRYKWQLPAEEEALRKQTGKARATYRPTGELVVVEDFRQPAAQRAFVLAWKFNIYAHEPVSRAWVYVDAHTGQVVLRDAIIKHVNATGTLATRYLGPRQSSTDAFGGGFRLRETVHGKGVTTLNLQRGEDFASAVDFTDNDNNWTAAEHNNAEFDNAAFDAHIGAQTTQDYWTTVHGRDSYDDQGSVLLSYVHFGDAIDNAFWDGNAMLYGDGDFAFRPLTAVDVCGHEIGHAVCETTANLVYQNESGALNEALSDIWGACVEHHLDSTKQTWLLGEDIALQSPALRSMSNPNDEDQPDTYLGTDWYSGPFDNGGVHTNSGVLNFWFYLLSEGGTGTNDNGTAYVVPKINIHKAARITYRAERLYMTSTSEYADARLATLQAAIDLYGLGSNEVRAVAQAWRAVGLGAGTPTLTGLAPTSGPIGTLVTISGANLGTVFRVTFNGAVATTATLVSAGQLVATVPPGATTGPVVLTTAAGTATSVGVFTVTGAGTVPSILSFSPAGGAPQGATVIVTGTGFTGTTAVRFNGTTATFTVNSATQITATVPATATSGALSVTTPGGIATAPRVFLVLPKITALAPGSGVAGASVTITGTSFTGVLNVKFNGTYALAYTSTSATSITATVPVGATTGPVTVRTPSGTATSPQPFVVTPSIAIASFTPPSGPVLTTIVTIYGVGFTGATVVRFNNTPATVFTVVSDTEIWATVPTGATSGPLRVISPVGTAVSATSFVVLIPGAPTVTSFTPLQGVVGDAVTLLGTFLQNATSLTFNGTPAPILSNTATRITTTVPAGATTGQLSVTTPLGTGISTQAFRVVVPPANDICTAPNLPVLTCGVPLDGSCLGARASGAPGVSCGTSVDGGGVFYRFVGTGSSVTVATCGPRIDYDGKLHVFSGACANLVCLGGDDDGCGQGGGGSEVTFNSVAGTSYLIFVSGWQGAQGDFTLTATCAAPPPPPVITAFTPTSGPVGTNVVINGQRFTGATAVKFNGTTATTYLVNSATRISATVPPGATTGTLSVTTGGGTGTSTGVFTVTGTTPAITSFTPASGPVGTSVVLTGVGFTGATAVKFNGTAAPYTVNSATQLTATVAAGSTTGAISVTTAGGAILVSAAPFTVTAAAPTLSTLTPTSGPVGTTVTISGLRLTGTTAVLFGTLPATSFAVNAAGTQVTAVVPASAGYVQVRVTTGAGSALTAGSFCTQYTATATPAGRCGAGPVTLLASGAPATGVAAGRYAWYTTATGGTPLAGATGATFTTPSLTASTTYYVAVAPAAACAGTRVPVRATINLAPTVAVTANGPVALCSGASVTLTATGATSYLWNTGATTASITVSAPGTYSVTGTGAGGCAAAPVARTLTVAPAPAVPTATPAARCGAGTLSLRAGGAPTGGSYRWYAAATGGTPLAGATGATFTTPTLAATATYYVSALSAAGCESTTRRAVVATVNALPAATVAAGGPTTFCAGDSLLLTASAAAGGSYLWSTGATTPRLLVRTAGTYTVTVTSAAGCPRTSAPLAVTVRPRPALPTVTRSNPPSGGVVLTSSAPTGNQWYLGGVAIAGATQRTYAVTALAQNGQYTVTTTSAAGCPSEPSTPVSVTVTGAAAEAAAATWHLWPNPAHTLVQCSGALPGTVLHLYDGTGRLVRTTQADASGAATLDVAGLARGVYAVRTGQGRAQRLVLE